MPDQQLVVTLTGNDNLSKVFKSVADTAKSVGTSLQQAGTTGSVGIEKLGASAEKTGSRLSSLKADAAAIGTTMGTVLAVVSKAGSAYRDQERQIDAVSRAYGSASGGLLKFAEEMQATTRYSNDAVRQSEVLASSLSKNYQISGDQIEQLISRSADLAQLFGIGLEDAVQRTSSAIRGEGEAAEALALNMSDAAISAAAMQAGITNWNVPGALSEAEKAAFRFQVLMEQSSYATGAAADAASGASGGFRELINEFQDGAQAIGGFLGPIGQVAAEMAPLALLAPAVGAGFGIIADNWGKMSGRGKGIAGTLAAVSVAIPIGIALWHEYDNTVNAIPKVYDKLEDAEKDYYMRGDVLRSNSLQSIIQYSDQAGAAFAAASVRPEGGPALPGPSDSAWAEMLANIATNLNNSQIDVVKYTDFVNGKFAEIAERPEDINTIMGEINNVDLTQFALTADSADNALKRIIVTAEQLKASATDLTSTLDDMRIGGDNELASQFEKVQDVFGSVGTEQQQAIARNRDYWSSLTGPDREAAIQGIVNKYSISAKTAEDLAAAEERVYSVMQSGQIDNARLIADLDAIDQKKQAGIITDEQAAAQYIATANNLSQYIDKYAAMKDAQVEFLANGDNLLDWWQEYNDVVSGQHMSADQWQMGQLVGMADDISDTGKALDQVLRTYSQIDAIGQRSASAGSIADTLIGAPGELGAIQDLWDRIAAGTSDAALSQQTYNSAISSGMAIQESNVRVQDDLNVIRAKQMPLLAEEQAAYEANIARLSELAPLEQRRVLMLQDSAVQSEIATLYSQAYAASIGEIPKEAATKMILEKAEADAGLKDLLLDLGLLTETDGVISVNFPDAESVGSSIDRVTLALLHMQALAEGKTVFEVAVEIYGEDEASKLLGFVSYADGQTAKIAVDVETTGTGVDDLKQVTLADGTVVTVTAEVDTTGWEDSTVGDLINNGASVDVQTVLEPPTGMSVDDWNASIGPLPEIEVPVTVKPTLDSTADPLAPIKALSGGDSAGASLGATFTVSAIDNASAVIQSASDLATGADGKTATMTIEATDNATPVVDAASENLAGLEGQQSTMYVAADASDAEAKIDWAQGFNGTVLSTSYIDIVTRTSTVSGGTRTAERHGGVPAYASGGVLFEAGEAGPEQYVSPSGLTSLLPTHSLYMGEPGGYVRPANAVSESGGPNITLQIYGNIYGMDDLEAQLLTTLANVLTPLVIDGQRGAGL